MGLFVYSRGTDYKMSKIRAIRKSHIDLLRGFAMLYIIAFWHLDDYIADQWNYPATEMLTYAILNIFIFISSFMLTERYGQLNSYSSLFSFLKRRILRIYPLYLFTLLAYLKFFSLSKSQFVTSMLLVNMFSDNSVMTLWFIGMIFIYYFLLALILFRFSWLRFFMLSAAFLFFTALLFVSIGQIDKRLILYFPAFLLGIASAKVDKVNKFLNKDIFSYSYFILPICAVIMYLLYNYYSLHSFSKIFLYTGGLFLIAPLYNLSFRFFSKIDSSIVHFLSFISFCMYLSHRLVYALLFTAYRPESDILATLYLIFIGVPSVMILSYFLQFYYNKLIEKFLNNRALKMKSATL